MVNHESATTRARSLDEGIGLLLTQICRAHRNLVAAALDEIDVHVGQDHFLYRLAIEDGLTQSQLAEALCIDASTVTKTLGRLGRDGLVERRPDPADGRIQRVHLTPRGQALLEPVVDIWTRAEQQLVEHLGEAERLLLRRLLLQVLTNLTQASAFRQT